MDTTFYQDLRDLQTAFDNTDDMDAKLFLARRMRQLAENHAREINRQYSTITSMQKAA